MPLMDEMTKCIMNFLNNKILKIVIIGITLLGLGVLQLEIEGYLIAGEMKKQGKFNDTSPITMEDVWNPQSVLSIFSLQIIFGSLMCLFFITAICVRERLCKKGNAFLVNVALADLLDNALIASMSALVIMSHQGDTIFTCTIQVFMQRVTAAVKFMSFVFIAHDNFQYMSLNSDVYDLLYTKTTVAIMIVFVWLIATAYSGLATFLKWGPVYCNRDTQGNTYFQILSFFWMYALPAIMTIYYHVHAYKIHNRHMRLLGIHRIFKHDWPLIVLNIINFILLVALALPYAFAQIFYWMIEDRCFYTAAWLYSFRSCFISALYGLTHSEFRKGFAFCYNYCCHKSTVVIGSHQHMKTRRVTGGRIVRFHVMYPPRAYSVPRMLAAAQVKL